MLSYLNFGDHFAKQIRVWTITLKIYSISNIIIIIIKFGDCPKSGSILIVQKFVSLFKEIKDPKNLNKFVFFLLLSDKKVSGKSKDEQMAEKKQELEKRLQDVTGQLGTAKKTTKKGKFFFL